MSHILPSLFVHLSLVLGYLAITPFTALAAGDQPNVVLIICDDLNDSVSGFGGHPQALTPNFDKFAATGVRFQRAYSNAPICAPSRASFLTGIYPSTSGNYKFDKWFEIPVLMNSNTLMGHFKANRYHVAGTGKIMHRHRRSEYNEFGYGADYGPVPFDGQNTVPHPSIPESLHELGSLDATFAPLSDVPFNGQNDAGWVIGNWQKPNQPWHYASDEDRDQTPDEQNAAWAADFLKSYSKNKPFFLAVGFIRPHTPLVAPQRFFDLFPIEEIKLSESLENDLADTHLPELDPESRGFMTYRGLDEGYNTVEAGLKAYTQAYLACVAAVDECLGQVLDALDESGYAENTIVIVTSDHGFSLGEKQHVYKNSLWEESARVPLIIRAPGLSKPGTNAEHPVSLIDLYPTLVDLCDLSTKTMKNKNGRPLDGHSLRPFIEDPENGTWDGPGGALTVVAGGWAPNSTHHYSLRTADWRYIRYNNGKEELYHHATDPHEWTNLSESPEHTATKQSLHDQLVALRGEPSPNATPVTPQAKPWDWFAAIDKDKNNKITQTEWLAWSKAADDKKGVPFDETKRTNAFNYFDADKNGTLSRPELPSE
ncbi:MAG: sulfatase-like hydrolase/transferase [Verrucomicrobiota bacterium]